MRVNMFLLKVGKLLDERDDKDVAVLLLIEAS
jgi:hypothetical protein